MIFVIKLTPDEDLQEKKVDQLAIYKAVEGLFKLRLAIKQRKSKSPGDQVFLYFIALTLMYFLYLLTLEFFFHFYS